MSETAMSETAMKGTARPLTRGSSLYCRKQRALNPKRGLEGTRKLQPAMCRGWDDGGEIPPRNDRHCATLRGRWATLRSPEP